MCKISLQWAVVLSFIVLSGCASNLSSYEPQTPQVTINKPAYTMTPGKPGVIEPGPINWQKNDNLALIPSSPFVYQQLTPQYHPADAVSHDEFAYVIGKAKNKSFLQVMRFPDKGDAISLGSIALNGNQNKIYNSSNRLLITKSSGGIELLDISTPAVPVKLTSVSTDQPVMDVQFDDETAYLLLENNTLLKMQFSDNEENGIEASLIQRWRLPFSARSIAVNKDYLLLAGEQGVGLVNLDKDRAKPLALVSTSGNPVDVQVHEGYALVTDGSGGLVIFSIENGKELLWKGSYNKRTSINRILIPDKQGKTTTGNKKMVFAVLDNGTLQSINLSNPQLPGSGPAFKTDAHILSATVLQDDVLLVSHNSIQRINMSGNNSHTISPEGVNQGGSRRGVIRDNILYVADWFSGLHLYDISIPQQPRHLSNYHTPGSSKGVTLYGNYVLIGDDDQGLQIVDIEDPRKPIWVSELTPDALSGEGLAYTMKRVGKILYLADHRGGFHILDLSDIYHPKRLGGFDTPGKSWGIDVSGKYVFVADDQSGLLIFDATDVSNPKLVAQFDPGGQAEDVAIQDDRAYVAFFDRGLYVLDIQDPLKPAMLGHTPIPGNARGIELADGLAYVTGWESGLHIVDTRGPATPKIIGSFDTDGSAWGVNAREGYAYVLDWWGGIKVIDVRQPSNPSYAGQYHARGTLQQLRVRNRYLYAASGAGGLQVFDIKNPLNPVWVIGIDMKGHAQDIWHDESRAYVAAGDGGVVLLDTLDPFYTWRIGQIDTPGEAQQVRAWNDYLFIRDSLAGIIVVDVRNPRHPREISRFPLKARDLWVDDRAFWASTEQGLAWWPHGDEYRSGPNYLLPPNSNVNWVRTEDQLVITGQKTGQIEIWQLLSGKLERLSAYQAGEPLRDMKIEGTQLYLQGINSGLMVVDIHNPRSPSLTTIYPPTGRHTGIEIAGDAAFFAGENRMASVSLLPPITRQTNASGESGLRLPPDLPMGEYHLLKTSRNGEKQLFPNSLKVLFPGAGKALTPLQRYRQMLKSPQ